MSAWVSKLGESHHGSIVRDPLDTSNSVLTFTDLNSGGDIFTHKTFTSSIGHFLLSFDYLGDPTRGGTAGDLGGFVGQSYGLPGTHTWLAGTQDSYPGSLTPLPDVGQWAHIVVPFDAAGDVHIMLEDFRGSGGVAGDVYFDNIALENPHPTGTHEPATMLLLGTGLIGLAGMGRRKFLNNS